MLQPARRKYRKEQKGRNTGDATTGTAVPARPSLYGHGLLGTASEVGAGNVVDELGVDRT